MLPGADGLSICRGARSRYGGPILLLTALGEEQDEVIGLEAGADDYVVKPVRPRALIARIRNLLARAEGRPRAGERIVIGELVIDAGTRSAYRAGRAIALSSAEFDLLWMLARAAGAIVSREEIYRSLRGIEYDGLDRSMDVRIVRLRRKLGDDSKAPTLIKNVRGEGYLLSRQP
jgi:DNA-binding response OmpR family regulator